MSIQNLRGEKKLVSHQLLIFWAFKWKTNKTSFEQVVALFPLLSKTLFLFLSFYFVSEAPKFKNIFFFSSFAKIWNSSQIFRFQWCQTNFFTELMVYFSNMIWWSSLPEIYPVSGFFSDFSGFSSKLQISMVWTMFLQIIDSLFIKYDMIIFFSGKYLDSGFSPFFLNPLKIFVFYWFWPAFNDDFFRIFPDFTWISIFLTFRFSKLFKASIKVYSAHEVGL